MRKRDKVGNILSVTKCTKYMDRALRSNIACAFLINLFFLVLVLLFCDLKYEVSDDFVMASILSGAYGETQNPQIIFVNVLVGYALLPFYKLFPQISWYFVLQILLVFVSSAAITYFLLENMRKAKAIMLSLMLILFFTNDAYILVQFTKTAMYAVMAGSIFFIWALFEEKKFWYALFGGALSLAGTCMRFSCIYLAGGFLLFILIYEFLLWIKKEKRNFFGKKLIRITLCGSALIILAFSFQWLDKYTYLNDDAHHFFYTYNHLRAAIVDYKQYDYKEYAEEFEEAGITENEYYMIRTWGFADNEVFTIDKMEQAARITQAHQYDPDTKPEDVFEGVQVRGTRGYPVFLACTILLFLGIFLNYDIWWTMLISSGIGFSFLMYFSYRQKMVYRVEYGIYLGIFLCGVYFWKQNQKEKSKNVIHPLLITQICIMISIVCMIGNAVLYFPDQSYKSVNSNNRKAYVEKTFYRSWDFDIRKYRKVVNKQKPENLLLNEIHNNKQNFYFLDFDTTIQTLYYDWYPWENLPIGEYENYVYLAGVMSNFPDVTALLERRGVSNPLKSLVEENVYLVDNSYVDLKLDYLREHYYPEARVEWVDDLGGYRVWKFYEE